MSSEPRDNANEPEVDEVEAALSNLEVTLEGSHTDKFLVSKPLRASPSLHEGFFSQQLLTYWLLIWLFFLPPGRHYRHSPAGGYPPAL